MFSTKSICFILMNVLFRVSFSFLYGQSNNSSIQNDTLVVAFGSCNRQDFSQPLWKNIIDENPNVWAWLGDNIYGDTDNMDILKEKYYQQSNKKEYQLLSKETEIIGIWDDHDFGKNDGNKNYQFKEKSKQLFHDFFNEPKKSDKRKNSGVYNSHTYHFRIQ